MRCMRWSMEGSGKQSNNGRKLDLKTPDEMYESVIRRRDALMAERRIRRKKIVRVGAVAVSLVVLAFAAVLLYPKHNEITSDQNDGTAVIGSTDYTSVYIRNDDEGFDRTGELEIECSESSITIEDNTGGEATLMFGGDTAVSEDEVYLYEE